MKLLGHISFVVLGSFCVVLTQGSYLQFPWAQLPHEKFILF